MDLRIIRYPIHVKLCVGLFVGNLSGVTREHKDERKRLKEMEMEESRCCVFFCALARFTLRCS